MKFAFDECEVFSAPSHPYKKRFWYLYFKTGKSVDNAALDGDRDESCSREAFGWPHTAGWHISTEVPHYRLAQAVPTKQPLRPNVCVQPVEKYVMLCTRAAWTVGTLLTENSSRCRQLRRHVRKYNCTLCLANSCSLG